MTRVEAALIVIGMLAIVVALASVDWRLGLLALGVGLIGATVDVRRPA